AVRALLRDDPELVTLSEAARAELVAYFGLDARRGHVTPLAADAVFAAAPSRQTIEEAQARHGVRTPYVIALGTLEPRKNLVRLPPPRAPLRAAQDPGAARPRRRDRARLRPRPRARLARPQGVPPPGGPRRDGGPPARRGTVARQRDGGGRGRARARIGGACVPEPPRGVRTARDRGPGRRRSGRR